MAGEQNWSIAGSGFLPEFPPRRGCQLILPGFQKEHRLFQAVECAILGQKQGVQVFNLLFQVTNDLFTLVSRGCITLFRDLSRMVFTLRLLKGTKNT
jgi:hypothetical protein